jgi:hypothetical protein
MNIICDYQLFYNRQLLQYALELRSKVEGQNESRSFVTAFVHGHCKIFAALSRLDIEALNKKQSHKTKADNKSLQKLDYPMSIQIIAENPQKLETRIQYK